MNKILKDIKKIIRDYSEKIKDCDILIEANANLDKVEIKKQEIKKQTLIQAQKDFESLLLIYDENKLEDIKRDLNKI